MTQFQNKIPLSEINFILCNLITLKHQLILEIKIKMCKVETFYTYNETIEIKIKMCKVETFYTYNEPIHTH